MEVKGFPTSSDIYLELDGKKVAVVQSYTAKAKKTSMNVEALVRASRWLPLRARRPIRWS